MRQITGTEQLAMKVVLIPFVTAERLLEDFFTEVEKICEMHGISTEVVNDNEKKQ